MAAHASPEPSDLTDDEQSPGRWGIVLVAGVLVVAWGVALVAITLSTANPRVVSEPQLRQADVVVIGSVSETAVDEVMVVDVLAGEIQEKEWLHSSSLRIAGLADILSRTRPGTKPRVFLFALDRTRKGWQVTTTPHQQSPPVVYPAEEVYLDRARGILAQR